MCSVECLITDMVKEKLSRLDKEAIGNAVVYYNSRKIDLERILSTQTYTAVILDNIINYIITKDENFLIKPIVLNYKPLSKDDLEIKCGITETYKNEFKISFFGNRLEIKSPLEGITLRIDMFYELV